MPDTVKLLSKLAAVAIDSPANRESLVRIVDLIHDAVGAENVFLVNSEGGQSLVCGDTASGDELGMNEMGLWLVGHQMEIAGGPVAFDIIEDGRVSDIVPAHETAGQPYVSFSLAGGDGSGEMLIVKRSPGARSDGALFAFVDAAVPPVALALDRAIAVVRADRQREQMMALANAAELLVQAEHIGPVLEDLATAISRASGYDLVTIDVYDNESKSFTVSVINRAPQVETSLGQYWRRQEAGTIYPEAVLLAAIGQREPLLFSDLQNDERIPEYGRDFFKRAHIFSAGQFPITFHDEFLGVLRVASQRPRAFNTSEVDTLNGFAAQLAVALEAVEMYKSLAESERQLKSYAEELQTSMEVQHRLARTDPLTGIPNRRYVDEVVKGECARAVRHKTPLSLALVDIDFFKEVNDTFGHKAGDEALVQLGDLARRVSRRSDVVGRYGGDEFLFVLPKADLTAALKFADRFRDRVAGHVFSLSSDKEMRMNVSVGVAELDPAHPQKPAALVREADEALYEAKSKGRNRTAFFRTDMRAA